MRPDIPEGYTSAGYRHHDVQPGGGDTLPTGTDALLRQMTVEALSAMAWRLAPRFWQGPRITPDVNWMVFVDAPGTVWADGEAIAVRPGDSVFLPPGTRDCERSDVRREWTMLSIHFTATLPGGLDALRLLGFPRHVRDRTGTLARIAHDMVREDSARRPGWQPALSASATTALYHVLRHHGKLFKPGRAAAGGLARLAPALTLVENRMADPDLMVEDLATTLGVSTVRLRALFRETLGMSPVAYVRRLRIERACRYLRAGELSIKEAAAACGFRDVSFFYRVFRKETGAPPARWLAQGGT